MNDQQALRRRRSSEERALDRAMWNNPNHLDEEKKEDDAPRRRRQSFIWSIGKGICCVFVICAGSLVGFKTFYHGTNDVRQAADTASNVQRQILSDEEVLSQPTDSVRAPTYIYEMNTKWNGQTLNFVQHELRRVNVQSGHTVSQKGLAQFVNWLRKNELPRLQKELSRHKRDDKFDLFESVLVFWEQFATDDVGVPDYLYFNVVAAQTGVPLKWMDQFHRWQSSRPEHKAEIEQELIEPGNEEITRLKAEIEREVVAEQARKETEAKLRKEIQAITDPKQQLADANRRYWSRKRAAKTQYDTDWIAAKKTYEREVAEALEKKNRGFDEAQARQKSEEDAARRSFEKEKELADKDMQKQKELKMQLSQKAKENQMLDKESKKYEESLRLFEKNMVNVRFNNLVTELVSEFGYKDKKDYAAWLEKVNKQEEKVKKAVFEKISFGSWDVDGEARKMVKTDLNL